MRPFTQRDAQGGALENRPWFAKMPSDLLGFQEAKATL